MRLYQLEYKYESSYAGITKRRSFFYRPEFLRDPVLWKAIRQGNDIATDEDLREKSNEGSVPNNKREDVDETERKHAYRKMLDNPKNKSSSPRHKYR